MLELKDVSSDGSSNIIDYARLGVAIFSSDGTWRAHMPGMESPKSAMGPLTGLPHGTWLTNLPFEQVRAMAPEGNEITLKSDLWLRLSMEQILREFNAIGISANGQASLLSEVVNRIYNLSQEVIYQAMPETPDLARGLISKIRRSPSLATGLMLIHGDKLEATRPSDKNMQSIFKKAQVGTLSFGVKSPAEADLRLNFKFPRLTYAVSLVSKPIPDASQGWKQAQRLDTVSSKEFLGYVSNTEKPAILGGIFDPEGEMSDSILNYYVHGLGRGDARRSFFLLEEIDYLQSKKTIDFASVYISGGWVRCLTESVLNLLIKTCGGFEAASVSMSANMLAENILASALRKKQGAPDTPSGEGLWLLTRDRLAMAPIFEELKLTGAIPVSGYLGILTVDVPQDPEILNIVIQRAWELGLHLSMDEVKFLRHLGATIPCDRESFGGTDVDFLISTLVHMEKRNVLLGLDRAMSDDFDLRIKKYKEIFG
jgi:hypothetical protein